MKKFSILLLSLFSVIMVNAQTSLSFSAKSGDTELDASLSDLNANAKLDLTLFKKDMSVSFGVTDGKLDKMLITMQPADVYMSLEIGKITAKPIDVVIASYQKNKAKGWGVIAKEMGIKPGSKEFHALKGNAKAKKDKVKGNAKSNGNSGSGGGGNGKGKGGKKK